MSQEFLDHELVRRYLSVLRVAQKKPSAAALSQLVAAHLARIPFENISKLHYLTRFGLCGIPDIQLFLEGIEKHHFGGTCYSNNFHFCSLLASLGYEVKLCGADMNRRNAHMVVMANCEGREHLIDAGYAAPFVAPMPRDLPNDYVVVLGRDRYVLKPVDGNGCSRLELHREGVLKHGYLAKPDPKKLEDFSAVIADSFQPGATFRHAVLLTKFGSGWGLMIHNMTVIESREEMWTMHSLAGRAELAAEIEKHFEIPRKVTEPIIAEVDLCGDAWA